MGDVYEWHWSHKPGQSCDYRKSATFWHYSWMRRYYAMGGWDLEVAINGFEFDGINREKKLSLLLADKLAKSEIDAFVSASASLDLKPVVIINAKAFKGFTYVDGRLKPKQTHNPSWLIFWDHAQKGSSDRSASLWLDIEKDVFPDFGLEAAMYNLSYIPSCYGEIAVSQKPKQKS